jgi:hypothetical protein
VRITPDRGLGLTPYTVIFYTETQVYAIPPKEH